MRRVAALFVACLLAFGLAAGWPGRCVACSCAMPGSLAEAVRRSPELAVFVGTVVAMRDDGQTGGGLATVVVDGRFRGPFLPATIRARYGGGADCTISMAVGERRLFTARPEGSGAWFPGLCDPQGTLDTPEGDALLAEAIATFGPAVPVGGPPVTAPAAPDPVRLLAAGLLAGVLGLALVGGVILAARRRDHDAS